MTMNGNLDTYFVPMQETLMEFVFQLKGGRFAPYANHAKPSRTVSKGPKDLILRRIYRKKTCCDVAQTHPAFISVRKLATTWEASEDCLLLWEFLKCSICDPLVGVQSGLPLICASLCDRLYDACSDAYLCDRLYECLANEFKREIYVGSLRQGKPVEAGFAAAATGGVSSFDFDVDPELALVLRVSMQEKRATQEEVAKKAEDEASHFTVRRYQTSS